MLPHEHLGFNPPVFHLQNIFLMPEMCGWPRGCLLSTQTELAPWLSAGSPRCLVEAGGGLLTTGRCVGGFDLADAAMPAALLAAFICGAEALGSADVRPGRTTDAAQQRERKPASKQLLLAAL